MGMTCQLHADNLRLAGAHGCGVRCSCRRAAVRLSLDCLVQHVHEFCVEEARFRVCDGAYGGMCSVVAASRDMGNLVDKFA